MRNEDVQRQIDALLYCLISGCRLNLTYVLKAQPPGTVPLLSAEFFGPDISLLVARNAELLLAFEHLATQALRLEPEQHDLIHFDADGYKVARERRLDEAAAEAVRTVRSSGRPYRFPPMTSRERRLLHLTLAAEGLLTRSEGMGAERHLVLHPAAIGKS